MKYMKLDISAKALRVMQTMRKGDRVLIPFYSRIGRCNRYCVMGDFARDVSELTLTMKDRLFRCKLISPMEDGVRWELNHNEHDKLLAILAKRRKLRNSDDPHRPVPKGVQ